MMVEEGKVRVIRKVLFKSVEVFTFAFIWNVLKFRFLEIHFLKTRLLKFEIYTSLTHGFWSDFVCFLLSFVWIAIKAQYFRTFLIKWNISCSNIPFQQINFLFVLFVILRTWIINILKLIENLVLFPELLIHQIFVSSGFTINIFRSKSYFFTIISLILFKMKLILSVEHKGTLRTSSVLLKSRFSRNTILVNSWEFWRWNISI